MSGKLGMTTTQRKAVLRNQASNLLWYGRLETTLGRAKELRPYTEKIITLAMNTYDDTIETTVTVKDKKGKDVTTKVLKDGPKKLAARRKIMTLVYDLQEQLSHCSVDCVANQVGVQCFQNGSAGEDFRRFLTKSRRSTLKERKNSNRGAVTREYINSAREEAMRLLRL